MKDYSHKLKLHRRRWVRGLLIVVGTLSVALGIVGMFVPVLPTVPFIILASVCYARASRRFYNWLMNHRLFGPPLVAWQETRSVPVRAKILAVTMITLSAGVSILFWIPVTWVKIAVGSICLGVCVFLLRLPSRKRD